MEPSQQVSALASLESRFISQLLKYLGPYEITQLAATCKDLRQKVRKIMFRECKLNYTDTRSQIGKNFFQIMKNNYNKKVLRLTVDEFGLLLNDPKSKALKVLSGFTPFFPGKRLIKSIIGPKVAGFLLENRSLHLVHLECVDKLVFKPSLTIDNVERFEVFGWVVIQKTDKSIWTTSLQKTGTQKEDTWTPLEPVPNLYDDRYSELVKWTSNFDHVALVYKHSGLVADKKHTIYVAQSGFVDPAHVNYDGDVTGVSLGKNKLYVIGSRNELLTWDLKMPSELVVCKDVAVKKIFTNGLLSFLMQGTNQVKKLELFTPDEVLEWFSYLRLDKFEDVVRYSKIDGSKLAKFTREDYQALLGVPYDSPEVNQLVMHNRLLLGEYFKNPNLFATGYNGNNELGVNTGNNMIVDFQEFQLTLDDYSDDVKDITFGGCVTFLRTRRGRKFTCFGYEDAVRKVSAEALVSTTKDGKNRSRKGSHRDEPTETVPTITVHDSDSDGSDEAANTRGGKPKKKTSRKKEKLIIAKPDHRVAKKFEKIKWREVSEAFEKAEPLKNHIVDDMFSTKNYVYLVCHERLKATEDEVAKDRLIATGDAVSKVLKDPKLKLHSYTVGVRSK